MQKADPKGKDDWKAFADDIIAYGEHQSLKEPVYGFTKHSGEAFDWLEDHGLAAHHLEPYAGHSNLRAHRQDFFKGRDYIDVLVKEIAARKLAIHHGCGLTKFFFDEKANRVVGVECGTGDKTVTCRARMGVVMATGGITGSPESLDRWVPSVAGKGVVIGGPSNTGEAMMIAVRDVGTPLSHMQYIASYPCGIVTHGRNGPYFRWWFISGQGGILINKNGKRFITEREGICHVTPKLASNPVGCHYILADEATWQRTLSKIKLPPSLVCPPGPKNAFSLSLKKAKTSGSATRLKSSAKRAASISRGSRISSLSGTRPLKPRSTTSSVAPTSSGSSNRVRGA